MILVLPDTSVWARIRQSVVANSIADAIDENRVVVVAPVVLEVLRGSRNSRELHLLARRFDALRRVPLRLGLERRARQVQHELASRGYHRGPSAVDLLAAAAAESIDAELWHCDRHFDLIAEVTGQPVRRVGE